MLNLCNVVGNPQHNVSVELMISEIFKTFWIKRGKCWNFAYENTLEMSSFRWECDDF